MNSEYSIGETGEYIYLIQERESIRCKDDIYKIGKTNQEPMKRMRAYPTGSKLWITIIVNDSTTAEKDLLALFREKFEQVKDYGAEYFKGNPADMIYEIVKYQHDNFTLGGGEHGGETSAKDEHGGETLTKGEDSTSSSDVDEDVEANVNEVKMNNKDEEEGKEVAKTTIPSTTPPSPPSVVRYKVEQVMNKIRKPVKFGRYTKILAEYVKDIRGGKQCSANIHIQYNNSNIFNVSSIELISPDKSTSFLVDINTLEADVDEDIMKMELTDYHMNRFKRVKVDNLHHYKVNVCSFEVRKFRGNAYYKTVILPADEECV